MFVRISPRIQQVSCSLDWLQTPYVTKDDLQLLISLSLPLKYWDLYWILQINLRASYKLLPASGPLHCYALYQDCLLSRLSKFLTVTSTSGFSLSQSLSLTHTSPISVHVCVGVWAQESMYHNIQVEVSGQTQVSKPHPPLWDVLVCKSGSVCFNGWWPVCYPHLALGITEITTTPAFMWVLGIWTQTLVLLWQALYPLSYLPAP